MRFLKAQTFIKLKIAKELSNFLSEVISSKNFSFQFTNNCSIGFKSHQFSNKNNNNIIQDNNHSKYYPQLKLVHNKEF